MKEMLKVLICCGLLAICFFVLAAAESMLMLGDGKWEIMNIEKCDDLGQFEMEAVVERRRLNRSHEMFNAEFDNKGKIIDGTYACQINICKYVDGGCKPYLVLADDSLERFLKQHAKSNMVTALELAGIDPPDFPLPGGKFSFNKYIFNYDELPIKGIYGEYRADAFLIKDFVKVGCMRISLKFAELEDGKLFHSIREYIK